MLFESDLKKCGNRLFFMCAHSHTRMASECVKQPSCRWPGQFYTLLPRGSVQFASLGSARGEDNRCRLDRTKSSDVVGSGPVN